MQALHQRAPGPSLSLSPAQNESLHPAEETHPSLYLIIKTTRQLTSKPVLTPQSTLETGDGIASSVLPQSQPANSLSPDSTPLTPIPETSRRVPAAAQRCPAYPRAPPSSLKTGWPQARNPLTVKLIPSGRSEESLTKRPETWTQALSLGLWVKDELPLGFGFLLRKTMVLPACSTTPW